jgi:hypothetical protein
MCNSYDVIKLFKNNLSISMGCYAVEKNDVSYFMPFNILKCNICKTFQTEYLGDINIVYNYNAQPYGYIRTTMYNLFAKFILNNYTIKKIIEIGGGNGLLSDIILEQNPISYTIVDPSYSGNISNKIIINSLFENIDNINADTIILSHVFEHFYKPLEILEKIYNTKSIKYIYINHPNLENYIKTNCYLVLNPEHTFYVENNFIIDLFSKYGFMLSNTKEHMDFSIFYEFTRVKNTIDNSIMLLNRDSEINVINFFENIKSRVDYINNTISNLSENTYIYIWPCSMHTIYLCTFGLNTSLLCGVLDNSEHKIGKFLYGEKLQCFSFKDILQKTEKIAIILNGGIYNKEINITQPNIIFI